MTKIRDMSNSDLDRIADDSIRNFNICLKDMTGDDAHELNRTMNGFNMRISSQLLRPDQEVKLILSSMQVAALSLSYDFILVSLERVSRHQKRMREQEDDEGCSY